MDVNTQKNNIFVLGNLRLVKECGMVVNAKFKARDKKLVNL
jgi:hypothetical protein